ncbi:winged helix-turn-helix transcriptional regulator [Gordonia effusa]|uniref:winged helix-turn-helix transcriptional regulator n=1 Tax=Gordonia effusa TaxID=263908 RepID=UPI0003070F0B|nr:winged helix-turn-helix transcriptional regulator [Gordonia effusa]
MTRRSYDQFCGLSRALDIVGERWTLLIVRELMSGPKRYSDLAGTLVGIGTSLLANRLKQLDADGILTRRYVGPPVASTVYELTDVGQELANSLAPLAIWGVRHQISAGPDDHETYHVEWTLLFLSRMLRPAELSENYSYEVRVGDDAAWLTIRDGIASVAVNGVDGADAVVTTDPETMAAISGGRVAIGDAIGDGRVTVEGNPDALAFLLPVLEGVQERITARL